MTDMIAFSLSWRDPSLPEPTTPTATGLSCAKTTEIREWLWADEGLYPATELITEDAAEGYGKWRNPDEDMVRLSRAFPEVLFTLCAAGEEPEDLWRSYYHGGLLQHAPAQITYPSFDPDKLTGPAHSGDYTDHRVAAEDTPEADALANHEARKGPWT